MYVLTVANNKGGVGKTTITKLVAEYLASDRGLKVLLIDLDSQCNLSNRFIDMDTGSGGTGAWYPPIHPEYDPEDPEMADWSGRSSIADIYYGTPGIFPYPTGVPNLELLPAWEARLLEAERVTREEVEERIIERLRQFLRLPDLKELYDIAVVDTAPSKTPTTLSAIRAATHVLIPTMMDPLGIEGLYGMLEVWSQESRRRQPGDECRLVGILPNMIDNTNNDKETMEQLWDRDSGLDQYLLKTFIKKRAPFKNVTSPGAHPKSVLKLPPSNPARREAISACEQICERIFTDEPRASAANQA